MYNSYLGTHHWGPRANRLHAQHDLPQVDRLIVQREQLSQFFAGVVYPSIWWLNSPLGGWCCFTPPGNKTIGDDLIIEFRVRCGPWNSVLRPALCTGPPIGRQDETLPILWALYQKKSPTATMFSGGCLIVGRDEFAWNPMEIPWTPMKSRLHSSTIPNHSIVITPL